jgi:hypothetical protein
METKDMIDRESNYTIYQVIYRLKNGKKMRMAYSGDNKDTYEAVIQELEKRDDIRYLSKSVDHTEVVLFD